MLIQNEFILCKGIICNVDGLLLNTETLSYETDIATANRYGLKAKFDSYSRMIVLNMIERVDGLRDILPAHADAMNFKDEWGEHYRERLADTVPVKPGVGDVIERLAARNIPMTVATSSQGEKTRDVLGRTRPV